MRKSNYRNVLLPIVLSWTMPAADSRDRHAEVDSVVQMPALKVVAEWMAIAPLLEGDIVDIVTITRVTSGSPADRAGVKAGSILVSLQGVKLAGLTRKGFYRVIETIKFGASLDMELIVPWESKDTIRKISMPLKWIQQALEDGLSSAAAKKPNKSPEPTPTAVTPRASEKKSK